MHGRPRHGLTGGAVSILAVGVLAVGGLALGAGCTSSAGQEAARIEGVAAADAPRIDDCWRTAMASAPFQALKPRMGEHADSPTDAMKANPAKATADDAALLLALHQDYLMPCRRLAVESAAKVGPAVVAILAENYAAADDNAARLVAGRITWGAFVTENQTLITRRRAALLTAGEEMQRHLAAPRPVAREGEEPRERADAALALWARRQQLLLQAQAVGGAMTVLRCRYSGDVLTCTGG